MSFQDLKNKKSTLQSLQKQVQEKQSGGKRDEREWRHTFDKTTKVGESVIRFLPFGDGDRLPYAEWYEYSFKTPAGNYWHRSRTSIGEKDPVAELNSIQWDRNQKGDQDAVKKRGRKSRYIANIVVVKDPAHPENNGKVFVYKFGKAIHDKLMDALVPKYESQQAIEIFDLWKGANFIIRTKEKSSFVNYDDSTFAPAGPLHPDDSLLEKWYNGMYDLDEWESLDNYEDYDKLNKEMRNVLSERMVCSILGEEFVPDNANNQTNSFQQQQQEQNSSGQATQTQNSPNVDPFADVNTGEETSTGQTEDPFANMETSNTDTQASGIDFDKVRNEDQNQSTADEEDPFANLNI